MKALCGLTLETAPTPEVMSLDPNKKHLIENALAKKGWTLETLAHKSGLSLSTVKRFSSGRHISTISFQLLCQALGVIPLTVEKGFPPSVGIHNQSFSLNPFTQRGMLGRLEDIYGRDREIRQVFEFLRSGSSVALVGKTGLGSSSLLRAVELNAPQYLPERKPIYLNMREILDAKHYYATLAEILGLSFESQIQFQRELKKKRALLLLDGSEQLAQTWFTDGMRRQLRAWANAGDRSPLRLVVAAHRPLTELFANSGIDSPFANICHEITLQPWDIDTIRGFIETRLNGTEIQFSDQEIDAIADTSDGVPSQVMQECYRVYENHRS